VGILGGIGMGISSVDLLAGFGLHHYYVILYSITLKKKITARYFQFSTSSLRQ
jgi:hypothetical protein